MGLGNAQGLFMASMSEPFFAQAKTERGIGGFPQQAVFAPRSG
ncbi:hypothetical protein [Priestia filamentosa]